MKSSHNSEDVRWQVVKAMLDDFKKTLEKYKVPEREQKELIAIVDGTKKDIVESAKKIKKGKRFWIS